MIPTASDKPLFTPGPLTTSRTVKEAMLRDVGARDPEFGKVVQRVRTALLTVAGVSRDRGYETVLIQGSGTFAVESVMGSVAPADGKWLVLSNGAHGERMVRIAEVCGIPHDVLRFKEHRPVDPYEVGSRLDAGGFTHVSVVHCEMTTGILNPVWAIGRLAAERGVTYVVDSTGAFGGVKFDFEGAHIDYLVSTSNKCLEGVPGFAFAICRREKLLEAKGRARSFSLDLVSQWQALEQEGAFRFAPPTHALLAFDRALAELEQEGGVAARNKRYRENHRILVEGMRRLGFQEYLAEEVQGPIITAFRYPLDPRFRFRRFYDELSERGYLIYPARVSSADCFRIGTIGRLFPSDVRGLLLAIEAVSEEMMPGWSGE